MAKLPSRSKMPTATRRLWVRKWAAEYVREQLGVPNCQSVILLEKTIRPWGKEPVVALHFYISSLDPDHTSPEDGITTALKSAKSYNGASLTARWDSEV